MRVDTRVTVTREMFTCRDHAVVLQTVDECNAHPGCQRWVLAVGSRVDHRVRRIVVDVQYGRVGDVYSPRTPFLSAQSPLLIRECRVASRAKAHLGREDQGAAKIDCVGDE